MRKERNPAGCNTKPGITIESIVFVTYKPFHAENHHTVYCRELETEVTGCNWYDCHERNHCSVRRS